MEFTQIPFKFAGNIFRSAMPYSSYDPNGRLIGKYLENNISVVVVLVSEDEILEITGRSLLQEYSKLGFEIMSLPIKDFGTPHLRELQKTISQVMQFSQNGKSVVVHCHAGVGRTGLFMAGLAKIGMGLSPKESIRWVRSFIPGALEVDEQEELLVMV